MSRVNFTIRALGLATLMAVFLAGCMSLPQVQPAPAAGPTDEPDFAQPYDEQLLDELALDELADESEEDYTEPVKVEYVSTGTGYYPDAFSGVPELDLGLDWEIELLEDCVPMEVVDEHNNNYHGFSMQIKYDDTDKRYDSDKVAEKYFDVLTAEGFTFHSSGELWGEVRNCDYYVYVKGDTYVDVEVFDGSNELNGIIIRLYAGDAAAYIYTIED